MQLSLELFVYLVFLLVWTSGLPIPNDSKSNIAPFGLVPLAYSRRGLSPPNDQGSAAGDSHVGRPQAWGGTPANTSICIYPAVWSGKLWLVMASVAMMLVALYGVLAFVMWGIMSVDIPRLTVWNRTGDKRRRTFAGKVLKVRNRPDWMLVSLVVVSVAIAEVLPYFWSHLLMTGSRFSYLTTNIVIMVSQVGPTFVMPVFHLEISGRFTWFVRLVMWLSAPVTVLPAYALRRLRQWRRRGRPVHMDGLLPLNELMEFIRLHEQGQGYGGMLDDHVGKEMRNLLERQISRETSSTHVETEGLRSNQFTESIGSTSVQSLYQEGLTARETESTRGPTSIRSHGQEGSTAVEDVHAPGLRRRGERSTEGYEPVVSTVPMQIPEQALLKDPFHRPPTLVNNRYVEPGASNGRPLQRDFPLQSLSNSVTPRRHRLPMMESYQRDRKSSGLVTDSFLLEQG